VEHIAVNVTGGGEYDTPGLQLAFGAPGIFDQAALEHDIEGRQVMRVPGDREQRRGALQRALDRIRQAARRDHAKPLTALWHHVYDINRLREAYDGFTWSHASIFHNVMTRLGGVGRLVQVGVRMRF
jgi:hypothetical protein